VEIQKIVFVIERHKFKADRVAGVATEESELGSITGKRGVVPRAPSGRNRYEAALFRDGEAQLGNRISHPWRNTM